MMNDQLVLRCSEAMARRLLARPGLDDAGRIGLAYRRRYARPPTGGKSLAPRIIWGGSQSSLAARVSAPSLVPLQSWQALCQAIIAVQ